MRTRLAITVLVLCGLAGAAGIHAAGQRTFNRTIAIDGDPVALAVDSHTHRAFVVNGLDQTVDILNTSTGNPIHMVQVGSGAYAIAVDEHSRRVFLPNAGDNSVSVLDALTGSPINTVHLPFSPNLIATSQNAASIFVTSTEGTTLAVLDSASGLLRGIQPLKGEPLAMVSDEQHGHLLIATTDNTLEARDGRNGNRLNGTSVGNYPLALAIDPATDRVFVANGNDATVSLLDARTLNPLRTVNVPRSPVALASVDSAGVVVLASTEPSPAMSSTGSVSILDARSGTLLRTVPIDGNPVSMAVDDRYKQVLIDVSTAVLVVDALTGITIRALPVHGMRVTGQAIAVDESSGHLFVVNTDDSNAASESPLQSWVHRLLPFLPHTSTPYGSINEYDIRR